MGTSISYYNNVKRVKQNDKEIPFDLFLESIKDGTYQDLIITIRRIKNKKERDEAKQKLLPGVCIAGLFRERNDAGIEKHSGFLAVDLDDLEDPEATKELLMHDRYVYAVFVTASGTGLCVIFRVNAAKHREAFQGIGEYLYEKYKITEFDPTSINVSRFRFVSWDPNIYIAANCEKFTLYPKTKPPKKVDKTIYDKGDFDNILNQITARRLNLVEDYHDWLRIAFSLVHKFGDAGRQAFHTISQYSSKYDGTGCDRQYTNCLKARGTNTVTIATFYYYAKEAGLEIYSERTKIIAYTTFSNKRAGLTKEGIAKTLKDIEGITEAEDIINQVYDNNIQLNEDGLIDQLEMFIRQNYNLRRNEITRYIEHKGLPLQQKDFNSIYIKAKKSIEKTSYELIDRLINSEFIPTYNPFTEFFIHHKDDEPQTGLIEKMFGCIETDDKEYAIHFGKKWYISMISAIHGIHSPLFLVLSGKKIGTGKTEFFRRMLPHDFHKHGRVYPNYYAESKLDAGKDDEILMTQKILLVDDEMGGKSKKESKFIKEICSKQTFSLREPYGRNNVDLIRLALLGGVSNEDDVVPDVYDNRRILPVRVYSIDNATYNSIDKTAMMMEAYRLWQQGFDWQVAGDDIEYLKGGAIEFEESNLERDLITKYFEPGTQMHFTASDVKVYIENKSNQRLILARLGKELKRLGFVQHHIKTKGGHSTQRMYAVTERAVGGVLPKNDPDPDDLPF